MAYTLTRQSRVVGALLALHAGDSLGATVEFQTHKKIASIYPDGLREIIGGGVFRWPPGHATDDTDMTRAVLLAYRDRQRAQQQNDYDVVARAGEYFLDWYEGRWPDRDLGSSPADIGNATTIGLRRFAETRDPDRAGAGVGSAGNGSLMRCLPTGLFQTNREKLISESLRISAITHDDARCTLACAVYNVIVAELVNGSTAEDAVSVAEEFTTSLAGEKEPVQRAIANGRRFKVADMARQGPPSEMPGKCSGFVLESLAIAVSAVLDERSLEDVLVDVVRIGRDTDTNAAIAGGLLGARHGVEAIPNQWSSVLQFQEEFTEIATELLAT